MTTTDELPRNEDGTLAAWAWPGGYPIMYLDAENCVLCPECADLNQDETFAPVAYFIHWEGQPEICENCNKQVESAYGDPDEEE